MVDIANGRGSNLLVFSELVRGDGAELLKCAGEGGGGVIADLYSNLLDGRVGVMQKLFSFFDTFVGDVAENGLVKGVLEQTGNIGGAQSQTF